MYLEASFSVCILLSLSDGSVGMILRKDAKASFRDWVRCLSRTLARTRWFCSSSYDWVLLGLGFLPRFCGPGLLPLLSSLDFLLLPLFLAKRFCCLSSSSSLVTRLSTGETGELEPSSISFLKKCRDRAEKTLSTVEAVVTGVCRYPYRGAGGCRAVCASRVGKKLLSKLGGWHASLHTQEGFFLQIFLETLSRFQMLNSFEGGGGGVWRAEGEPERASVR